MSWTILSFVVFVVSVIQATLVLTQDEEKSLYNKRYDSIDVTTLFRSTRLLNNYVDCLLDKKPCPPEGKDLKRVIPHALRTSCARCTKSQKAKALDVITRLYYEHPSAYLALAERYDPTGEYTRNFENWFDEQNSVKPRPPIPDFGNIPLSDSPSSGNQSPKRSPSIDVESSTSINNLDYAHRTRIPSSWITTTTTTTPKPTTTRSPLRTTIGTRTTVKVLDKPSTIRAPSPPPTLNNPNFLLFPRPNGPITHSINKLLDTTDKLAVNIANMFKTTLEILAG